MKSDLKERSIENDYHLAKLFVLTIRQFFESTSLHGFRHLVQAGRNTYEKLIWYFIQLVALSLAGYLFLHALHGFSANPTFTSLQSVKYPVWEVPFPAVVVCSVNKISKKAAAEYAKYLAAKTPDYSEKWFFEKIKYLGHVHDLNIEHYDEYIKLQDILDVIDVDNETKIFNTQTLFENKLSPRCEDLVLRCQWDNAEVNCSEFIYHRKTSEGYCCAFNYVRTVATLSEEAYVPPFRAGLTGMRSGLVLILNTTQSDYYFANGNTLGFNVLVYYPTVFPDNQNGGLMHLFVSPETETFFKLDVTSMETDPDVEQYSPAQRGCLLEHELRKEYAGHYSYVDCLLKCKFQRIIALCGCMPLFWPINFPDKNYSSEVKCTLAHNKCLLQYYKMVNTFWSPLSKDDDTQKSTEDYIECPQCLPICTKTTYRVTATYSKILADTLKKSSWSLLQNLSTTKDVSIMHVYYPFYSSTRYRTDVVLTWEDIISSFGGLLGLCLGFSLINFAEILYFATVRAYKNIPTAFKHGPTTKWPK